MAATAYSIKKVYNASDRKEVVLDVNIGVYATGGVPIAASNFQLDIELDYIQVGQHAVKSDDSRAVVTTLNTAGTKIQCWGLAASASGLTEIGDTVDLTGYTCRLRGVGKGSASFYPTT